jgi:hypothetical protein
MKIDKKKLTKALEYIEEINNAKFHKMDFSEITLNKEDFSEKKKEEYFWIFEGHSNIEIVKRILEGKIK